VKALLGHVAGMDLAHEGERPVQVSVPRDRADSREGETGQGRARVGERLCGVSTCGWYDVSARTSKALTEEEALDDAKRAYARTVGTTLE
jgi:hypothetical protein